MRNVAARIARLERVLGRRVPIAYYRVADEDHDAEGNVVQFRPDGEDPRPIGELDAWIASCAEHGKRPFVVRKEFV